MGDATISDDSSTEMDLSTQADADTDGGVTCTGPDTDGDGIPNACDRCLLGADQLDADLDTIPDACDACPGFSDLVDADSDGVADGCDICALGDDLVDGDGDGVPLACDVCDLGPNGTDADGDGVPDACDRCEGHPDDSDTDGDEVPNGCDVCSAGDDNMDSDDDAVPDACDACAGHDDGVDTDGDGVADGCDCEPTLDTARPGLTEVCDGLDNDCAGGVDNGLVGCAMRCRPDMVDWDLDGATCESAGRVIYADVGLTTGANDGTSWANAHRTLEAAIVDAESTPAGRKQIWIAEGSYAPTRDLEPGAATIRGFSIPASTALLGGFTGTEVTVTEANPTTTITTLGQIGLGTRRIIDVKQPDIRVDGIVIQEGFGRGVSISAGELLATRVQVASAPGADAGVHVSGGVLTMRDALIYGGAIGVDAVAGTFVCERCVLRDHTSLGGIGSASAVRITAGNVTLRHSAVFRNASYVFPNATTGLAGGVTVVGAAGRFRAENTTIAGNSGGRYVALVNSVNAGLDVQAGAATIINSIIQQNTGSLGVNATFISSSVQGEANQCAPLFADTTTVAGLTLGAGSTCIDAGDASMTQGTLDVLGAPRIQGAGLDLGAIETTP
jgi:hypothetical protein